MAGRLNVQEPGWNKDDLVRRLCHALDVAKLALERLATIGYTDRDEPSNNVRPEKVISETALLLLAASTAGHHAEVSERIKCIARLLIPHARSERMLLGVCLEPALALDYAQAHICLSRIGYQDSGFDALLRQSCDSQARAGRERTPHRTLEQEWLREGWEHSPSILRKRVPPMALISVLNRPMDLLGGSREDIYAFTHALMYVTDFNVCPWRLPRRRDVTLAEAEAALARCLDEQDYDLAGEVLLAWPLTGKSWSAAAAFGFRVLAHVEDKAGFLPAPSTRLERLNQLQGEDRADYWAATAYHTVFVMGLLCAAALQPGRTPPLTIQTNTRARGCADKILALLHTDRLSSHWQEELDLCTGSERDALAGFVMNVALYRQIRRRNFGAVHKLLSIGYNLGLANSPASSQAAEMLERLAIFTETRRAQWSASNEEPGAQGMAI